MEIETFKPQFRNRDSGYRTPSPPPVEFFATDQPSFGASSTSPLWPEHNVRQDTPHGYQYQYSQDEKAHQEFFRPMGWSTELGEAYTSQNKRPKTSALDSPSRLEIFAAVATSPRIEEIPSKQSGWASETVHWNYSDETQPKLLKVSPDVHEPPAKRIRIDQNGFQKQNISHEGNYYGQGVKNHLEQQGTSHHLPYSPLLNYQPTNGLTPGSARAMDASIEDAELLLSFAQSSVRRGSQRNPLLDHNTFSPGRLHAVNTNYLNGNEKAFELSHRETLVNSAALGDVYSRSETTTTTPSTTPLESKRRVHKGWPKGKPRGTRQATSKVKPSKSRRSKASLSKTAKTTEALLISKTDTKEHQTDIAFDFMTQVREASKRRLSVPDILHETLPHGENRQLSAPPNIDERVVSIHQPTNQPATHNPKGSSKHLPEPVNICAACNSSKATVNGYKNLWIGCDGCKKWFHYVCAGFKNQREVRDIDKFYCAECENQYGPTTTVRKSSRAHTALDYAGLNEGVIRTSDDVLEHHFIKSIKTGAFQFDPETFPRMPPEMVTAEYFQACGDMAEPILIPAYLNPQPSDPDIDNDTKASSEDTVNWFSSDYEYDCVPDDGQDKLDMVIPRGLTVRQVANICGPDEKIDVIDVKNQTGEDKRWTLRQWADYYEAEGEKPVRNVISLEFSWSKLSKLVRRPKIARDLDLQDLVWPPEEHMKGNSPKSVQYYCLMSVADCYTDFHIDFGGSSVYYHILKGKKTFFFIPPKSKHLKKYEEWCNSKDQNNTWLPDLTQECYRVDLSVGDTMIIPSGWIHSVWTPENSLVIGGNFLTRMHYAMQIRINEIEKATKMALKFRYPMFQRVMWFAVIDYLKADPVPSPVVELLYAGDVFSRTQPIWYDHDIDENIWESNPSMFNARFYSQAEMEGLSALRDYILRTVKISLGKIDGVTKETQGAVIRSMPKGYGDHADLLKTFALWVAWKKGNETLPAWAFPDAVFPDNSTSSTEKTLSATAQKKRERQAAHDAWMASSDRPSRRFNAHKKDVEHVAVSDGAAVEIQERYEGEVDILRQLQENPLAIKDKLGIRIIPPADSTEEVDPTTDIVENFDLDDDHQISSAPSENRRQTMVAVIIDKKAPEEFLRENEPVFNDSKSLQSVRAGVAQTAEPPDGELPATIIKPSRAKACDDCRRSKRRCVHDENGQIDANKISEPPTRRGPNKSKAQKLNPNQNKTVSDSLTSNEQSQGIEIAPKTENMTNEVFAQDADILIPDALQSSTAERDTETPEPSEYADCGLQTKANEQVENGFPHGERTHISEIKQNEVVRAKGDTFDSETSTEDIHEVTSATDGNQGTAATAAAFASVSVPSLERKDINANSNSTIDAETKSRTSSTRLRSNSPEGTSNSRSRSSSPLTDVEASPQNRAESPDELSLKTETATTSGFTPRNTGSRKASGQSGGSQRRDGLRNVSTRASSFSTNTDTRTNKQKRLSKTPSRSKTPNRNQLPSPVSVPTSSTTKARSASATSENEDWKLALKLAAEDRGLRRRG